MKTVFFVFVLLVFIAINAFADEPAVRPALSTEAFNALSQEARQAYLAGLADGLTLSVRRPEQQVKMIATCMQGFPIDRMREITDNREQLPGEWKIDMNAPAAAWIISRFSLICQLQFTVPFEPK